MTLSFAPGRAGWRRVDHRLVDGADVVAVGDRAARLQIPGSYAEVVVSRPRSTFGPGRTAGRAGRTTGTLLLPVP